MKEKKQSKVRARKVQPSQLKALIDIQSYDVASSPSERVQRAKDLLAAGAVYVQGCSGFVCDVLGIPWESANSLMGTNPKSIGKDNDYSGANPGDIVGWTSSQGSGHVAVYIGDSGQVFIDVPGENKVPRSLANGYGPQEVFLSDRTF